ncbi:MAG: Arc family DNA binding domain-containing protein [bacterium]
MSERKRFLLRLNQDLWEELCGWAEQELRSVNAQIEFLLREAVNRRRKGSEKAMKGPDTS